MKRTLQKPSAVLALCILLAPTDRSILAQPPRARPSSIAYGASDGKVIGIAVGILAAGVLIGVGAYFALRHNQRVTGCARSGPDGMTLTSDSDKQSYSLIGDVAKIKDGTRVRVSGKRRKEKSSPTPKFLVEKVSRDFGPCEVAAAAH
jgi:hypothetical protein